MPFTVADFHDLVRLLEEHPDWRTELRRVLFSQDLLDLLRTVQELAVAQRHTEEAIARLTERMEWGFTEAATERRELRQDLTRLENRVDQGFAEAAEGRQWIRADMTQGFAEAAADRQRIRDRMEQGFAEAAQDRQQIHTDMAQGFAATNRRDIRRDIGQLKGLGQEQFYRDRAAAIFGRLLVQGYDATNQVADLLQEARRTGLITDRDYQEALAADLLWGGQLRASREPILLVRQAGLRVLPIAAGQEWPPNLQEDAKRAGVAIAQDGTVYQDSWERVLARS